ncbi:type III-B CRISPR module RAMP protein Cmr1 [Nocardiopsis algeriensis]|uniref:type III-B CRISPR module RAMP protein Cmr1 n=1 Tax=Nocardiopsis algeriensis TaxID=1478215 RepID=UPI003B4396E3
MWKTLSIEVATPVFSSAGTPGEEHLDTRPEIRVSSLRGGMRFWLRAMAAAYVGDDLHRLREVEDRVMGSTGHSSPIKMRIPRQPEPSEQELRKLLEDRDQRQWIGYLLGPGLTTKGQPTTKDFIPPGRVFPLKVRCDGKEQEDLDAYRCALAALWLSLTYGGVGSRIRRGFGGLKIVGAEEGLPWESGSSLMTTPGLEHYTRAEGLLFTGPAAECRPSLRRICADVLKKNPDSLREHDWREEPVAPFPVLGEEHTQARIDGGWRASSWQQVLAKAGEELRYFRAEVDADTQGRYSPPVKTKGWLDVVHDRRKREKRLPMAALGLPLVYKDSYEVRVTRPSDGGRGVEQMRRASPLWLRAVGSKNQWRLFSFAFYSEFLPESDDVRVNLWKGKQEGRELEVTTDDAHALTQSWIEEIGEGKSFIRR